MNHAISILANFDQWSAREERTGLLKHFPQIGSGDA
jgi:hypothetical protein